MRDPIILSTLAMARIVKEELAKRSLVAIIGKRGLSKFGNTEYMVCHSLYTAWVLQTTESRFAVQFRIEIGKVRPDKLIEGCKWVLMYKNAQIQNYVQVIESNKLILYGVLLRCHMNKDIICKFLNEMFSSAEFTHLAAPGSIFCLSDLPSLVKQDFGGHCDIEE